MEFFRNEDDGRILADFLGHYEFLAEDFQTAATTFGLPSTRLPRHNSPSNATIDDRSQFSDSMVEAVQTLFQADMDDFGDEFDKLTPSHRCSGPIDCQVEA